MTKDSAEARVEIERWAAAQIAQLEKARAEAMRKISAHRTGRMEGDP